MSIWYLDMSIWVIGPSQKLQHFGVAGVCCMTVKVANL